MEHFYNTIPGWFAGESVYRAAVIAASDGAHMVEIGAWKGKSAAFMGVEIANSGKQIRFDTIDHFQGSIEHRDDPDVIAGRLKKICVDNLASVDVVIVVAKSPAVAKAYADGSLDFIFLDGAHDQDSVAADIAAWRPKLKPDGILAGDDYNWPSVRQAVDAAFLDRVESRDRIWFVGGKEGFAGRFRAALPPKRLKIALCTPAYDGRVHDAHMAAVVSLMREAAAAGIEIVQITGRGTPILPEARNWLVAMALSQGCDKVFFVDSDIAWGTDSEAAKAVLNMLLAPVDIVAAVHQKRNTRWNDPAELVVRWKKIPPEADAETGLWEVARVATACVVIDKSAFERIIAAGLAQPYLPCGHFKADASIGYHYDFFWIGFLEVELSAEQLADCRAHGIEPPTRTILGEDFWFCQHAEEAGAKMFVDPRIKLIHFDGCVRHDVSLADVKFEEVAAPEAVADRAALP